MRVIAGRLKGRRLDGPRWDGLRPTSDSLRETLFNILGPRVDGARVLDGYAGTGAVGIEAISRGAAHVTFVERDRRALALIRRNLAACGVEGGYTIVPAAVETMAGRSPGVRFDIVVLDPPYAAGPMDDVLAGVQGLLSEDAVVVLEHASRVVPPARAGRLVLARRVTAGDSALGFYTASAPPGASSHGDGKRGPARSAQDAEGAWDPDENASRSTRDRSTP